MISRTTVITLTLAGASFVAILGSGVTAFASPFGATLSAVQPGDSLVQDVRAGGGGARRGGGGNVNRGNIKRNVNVNRSVVRTGGAWARPGRYTWPRGGGIAAGAAIGFVSAATAAAWAGAAPGPNMCWYYTDPTRT